MNKKKKSMWEIIGAIATVIIPLFIFFTGHETFRDFLCEKETETPNIEQKPTIEETTIKIEDRAKVIGPIIVGDSNTNIHI